MGAPLSLICRTALWGEFRSCQTPTTVSTSLFFVKTTDPWCYRIPPPGGVFLSPGFPCPECMLDTYYPPPASGAADIAWGVSRGTMRVFSTVMPLALPPLSRVAWSTPYAQLYFLRCLSGHVYLPSFLCGVRGTPF